MATTGTKVPSIYKVPSTADPELKQFAASIKEALEVRLGRRGDPKDRAITLRELIDSGLAKELLDNPFDPNAGTGATDFAPVVFTSSTIPPTPTGFSVSGAFTNIIVSWDNPQYNGLAYTEVWRHTIDEVGTSTRVDTTRSFVWADTVDPGETYFYWVRHVSTSDVIGAFSLSDSATTAKVDASIIQDAVITGQKLVDQAVTAAKIAGGTITASQIAAETIAAGNMAVGSITAGNAALADASIITAKIVDGAIVNAKIGNLAVDTAQIADAAITTAKVGVLSASAISTNTLNVAGLAIDGTMGRVVYSAADKYDFTYNNTSYTNFATEYAAGREKALLSSALTLSIPPTATAVAKSFVATGFYKPVGIASSSAPYSALIFTLAVSTSSNPATSGSWTHTEAYYLSGLNLHSIPLQLGFDVTTSTNATLTRYIHVYTWIYNIAGSGYNGSNDLSTGDLGIIANVSVTGLYR